MTDLPQHLIVEIQKHTNMPWWNGEVYAGSVGYHALDYKAKLCVESMYWLINQLRYKKLYEESDALRLITGHLARALRNVSEDDEIVLKARSYPDEWPVYD